MTKVPNCPECKSEHTYSDRDLIICPMCAYEWQAIPGHEPEEEKSDNGNDVLDAYGTPLQTGDNVSVIKDLKVKGASSTLKAGTKVKNIEIVDAKDGHDISCKITGFGAIGLKSQFVKKL
ncbi:alkylphosphonate utilization protein [Candidatus Marinamargulisbacteria bacterium SCGC AAA071-K20]|nr:alkylphosphonate utilization protein [Candidatus Marinamargulisbacteria bacterium SCGC AAA071-K20]